MPPNSVKSGCFSACQTSHLSVYACKLPTCPEKADQTARNDQTISD